MVTSYKIKKHQFLPWWVTHDSEFELNRDMQTITMTVDMENMQAEVEYFMTQMRRGLMIPQRYLENTDELA